MPATVDLEPYKKLILTHRSGRKSTTQTLEALNEARRRDNLLNVSRRTLQTNLSRWAISGISVGETLEPFKAEITDLYVRGIDMPGLHKFACNKLVEEGFKALSERSFARCLADWGLNSRRKGFGRDPLTATMGAPRSCHDCRQTKRKCIRGGVGESCNPCQVRILACSLKATPLDTVTSHEPEHSSNEERRSQVSEATQDRSSQTLGLSQSSIFELVELYLRHFHGGTHSIFHPNTLRTGVRSGHIEPGLLAAICALGSKFSSLPDRRVLENRLAAEAKRVVKADLENVCLENVQACLLLTLLSAGEAQPSSEVLFIRIATTMSEVLRLSSADGGSTAATEALRRVWWSLYLADRLCFSRLGLPRHLDHIDEYPPLPMEEIAFYSLTNEPSTPGVQHRPGIFGHLMLLAQIFGPIQDLNRLVAQGSSIHQQLDQRTHQTGQQLELWKANLPENLQMTVQNLHDHQQDDLGAHFVTLHLVYHHYSTLLYFYSLEKRQSDNPQAVDSVLQCQLHASSFSSLLHLSRQMKSCEPNYPITAHMITISSAVLLHTLLFGAPGKLPKARRDLNMNFEALLELRQYWPATETMIRKLIVFQNICLRAPLTHKLDGWMVRFLLVQSLGLEESFTVNDDVASDAETYKLTEAGRYTDFQALQPS